MPKTTALDAHSPSKHTPRANFGSSGIRTNHLGDKIFGATARGVTVPSRATSSFVARRRARRLSCQRPGSDGFRPSHLPQQHDPRRMPRGEVFVPHTHTEATRRVPFEHRVSPTSVSTAISNRAKNALVAVGKPLGFDTKVNSGSCGNEGQLPERLLIDTTNRYHTDLSQRRR